MAADKENKKPAQDPAGDVELGDEELEAVAGGSQESTECLSTIGCCGGLTNASPNTCCCKDSVSSE